MAVWSILLRDMLAVRLILKGSDYVVASAHTQMDHAELASTTPQPIVHPVATAEPLAGWPSVHIHRSSRPKKDA